MERRTFVRLSAYTAMALALPLADSCTTGSKEKAIAQPLLFSHIADVKAINEAGNAYRKLAPGEDNRDILTKLLLGNNTTTDSSSIQTLLDNRVKQDFRSGKTVTVTGWIMSETEARQCALYSILHS
jgi:hypothetical protein